MHTLGGTGLGSPSALSPWAVFPVSDLRLVMDFGDSHEGFIVRAATQNNWGYNRLSLGIGEPS